jgi:hypothetical protein
MFSKEDARHLIASNEIVQQRTAVMRKAGEINPDFKNAYIHGGMLRDVLLREHPRDCDVVFEGSSMNQPGIFESLQEAEVQLGMDHLPGWELENTFAHGPSKSIVENTIGLYSNHTDFLTLFMYNHNEFHIGDSKTLSHIETKTYDPRFVGEMTWVGLRGRTYFDVLAGASLRGLYLISRLGLNPSEDAEKLFRLTDENFSHLTPEQQERRRDYWIKKTEGVTGANQILEQYGVTCLK